MSGPVDPAAQAGRLRVLGRADLDAAAALLARVFATEAGMTAMFPRAGARRRFLERTGRAVVGRALPLASVHGVEVDGVLASVAVWHPPGTRGECWHLPALRSAVLQGLAVVPEAPHLLDLAARHRQDLLPLLRTRRRAVRSASAGPTWYLAYLATDARFRRRGLARSLLGRVLDRCDADGLAAWLETTDPVNPPVYERFGFRTVAHVERAAGLPGYWVMRRAAR